LLGERNYTRHVDINKRPRARRKDNITKWTGLKGNKSLAVVSWKQIKMAEDSPWSKQPSDRGRLKTRQDKTYFGVSPRKSDTLYQQSTVNSFVGARMGHKTEKKTANILNEIWKIRSTFKRAEKLLITQRNALRRGNCSTSWRDRKKLQFLKNF